jgi:hypothetical protein
MTRKTPRPGAPILPMRETDLKLSIVDYLLILGYMAWVNNVGAFKLQNSHGKDRFVRFGKTGQSDIFCVLNPHGRLLVVETKKIGNKATQAQIDFMADVEKRGGIAILAYSLDDVDSRLRKEGYIK